MCTVAAWGVACGIAGCADKTAILNLQATANATQAMSAYCVALGADGQRRFGRRYALADEPLPQSLAIDPAGRGKADLRFDGIVDGQRRFYVAQPIQFPAQGPLFASLDACVARPAAALAQRTSISFAADRLVVTRTGAEVAGTAQLVALAGTSGERYTFAPPMATMATVATAATAPALSSGAGDAVTGLLSLDMDGDCADDLVVTTTSQGPIGWPTGVDGAPAPDAQRIDDIPAATALAIGDLNADGLVDFVSANGGDGGAVFQGDGRGFSEKRNALDVQPTGSQAVAIGDFDGDGRPDIAYGFLSGPSIWLRNDGVGRFREQSPTIPGMFDTRALVAMDVDGDGTVDLVSATHDKGLRVFSNTGGIFTDASSTAVPSGLDMQLVGLVRADIDGDCVDDLIVLAEGSPPRWLAVSGGQLVDRGALGTLPGHDAVAADLDGDGKIEVAIATRAEIDILGATP